AGDANSRVDVYVADVASGVLRRASVGQLGEEYDSQSAAIEWSVDREWLAFTMSPSSAPIVGRYNAPAGPDVMKARNPVAEALFSDSFE
ncbi:MAG TPA: hypothetical protein VFO79_05140, partial [Xanthomonadales bacterium]|nr:hypothetical protein [Xanthomonadales bacterium]